MLCNILLIDLIASTSEDPLVGRHCLSRGDGTLFVLVPLGSASDGDKDGGEWKLRGRKSRKGNYQQDKGQIKTKKRAAVRPVAAATKTATD